MRSSFSRTISFEPAAVLVASAALLFACGSSNPSPDGGGDTGPADATHTDAADTHAADVNHDVHATGCRAATTCGACAAMNTSSITCGWSIASAACLMADTTGAMSGDGSSTGADWAPFPALCPGSTACHSAGTDCAACNAAADTSGATAGCGWCGSSNQCMAGIVGADGSQDGTCAAADWIGDGTQCPNAVQFCATGNGSCDTCTMLPWCGICSGSNDCVPGTMTGPLNGATQEMCPTGSMWAWLPPAAGPDCTTWTPPADGGVTDSGPADAGATDGGSVVSDASADD